MYLYISSQDSLDAYSANSPELFTSELTETAVTKSCYLGLCELSLELDASTKRASQQPSYVYVTVAQCGGSDISNRRLPILRLVALDEFTKTTPVLRFPDVFYMPIKQHTLASITVAIRPAYSCSQADSIGLTGVTRCTFHIKQQ